MTEYGVLLIGGKRTHQESHARAFAGHPLCRLVAVAAEPDEPEFRAGGGRELAEEHGIPYMNDLDEALRRDDVHIVSSAPLVERRGDVAVRCLEAGKHVYLDKPLGATLEAADSIVTAARRAGVRTQMFTQNRSAWVRAARRGIDEGRIGTLKAVHAENLFAKGRAGSVPQGIVRRERETVGLYTFVEAKREMFDVAVYSLAWVHMLTGRRVESVFAITGNYFFAEHARVDVEDFGALALRMEGGVTATAIGGRYGWQSHPRSGRQSVVLIGTKGTLSFDADSRRIEVYNDEPDFTPPRVDPLDPMGMWYARSPEFQPPPKDRWVGLDRSPDAMVTDVADFVDCIEQGRESDMNAIVAASLLETILAGYASAVRGEEVAVPLPRKY